MISKTDYVVLFTIVSPFHYLYVLRLWGNKIGDVGADAIAKALENSKTLVWLR